MQAPKETPLKASHQAAGGKLIDFAGWLMPVQYKGIREEHLAVRTGVGVFDISHMGQIFIDGPGALDFLNSLLTNDVSVLEEGQGQYTLMLNDQGGVIDDLIIYRTGNEAFFLVVNASMIDEDAAWMLAHLPASGVTLRNESDAWAGLAVQGPEALSIYTALLENILPLPARNGIAMATESNEELIICRTGYTGEDGFEFFCPAASASRWWQAFLDAGCTPCGLGARDTLRLEMGYPLNGNDLSPTRTPLEAGLGFFVKLDKGTFIGSDVLTAQKDNGIATKLTAFRVTTEKAPPPRAHYPLLHEGAVVGEIASGGLSPSLNMGIGMAYLPSTLSAPGTKLGIDIRGRIFDAEVVKKPFYKRPS